MSEYDNTNRGALFKNDKKEKDSHPDYKGSLDCEGTEYWLSAWIKESKNGQKYLSIAMTEKDSGQTRRQQKTAQRSSQKQSGGGRREKEQAYRNNDSDFDDDIPF